MNKTQTENYSKETMNVLLEAYRTRDFDVLMRGVHEDLSKMLSKQKPTIISEAYSICLETQNLKEMRFAFEQIVITNKDQKFHRNHTKNFV